MRYSRTFFSALLFFIAAASTSHAQKVKVKDQQVFVNDTAVLSYFKNGWLPTQFALCEKHDGDELITVFHNNNDTEGFRKDDYITITFTTLDKTITTSKATNAKQLVRWLLENEVLSASGELNKEKAEVFVRRFDERIK